MAINFNDWTKNIPSPLVTAKTKDTTSLPFALSIKTPSVGASPGTSPRMSYGSPLASAVANRPAAPATAPAPAQAPAQTFDFSKDALTPQAQQSSSVADMLRQSSPAPEAPAAPAPAPTQSPSDSVYSTPDRVAGYTDTAGVWHPSTMTAQTELNLKDFASPEDFAQALALRNMAQANDPAYRSKMEDAEKENQDKLYAEKMKSLGLNAENDAVTARNEYRDAENQLISQLAAKGMTLSNDSQAQGKMNELTQKFKDLSTARNAKYQADSLAAQDGRYAALAAEKDKELKAAQDAITNWQALQSKQAAVDNTQSQIQQRDKKSEIDEMYKKGLIDVKQKEALIKQADEESKADLRTSQAGLADANAGYVSGAKTTDTEAAAELKKAQTERITTLLPAELSKMKAEIAKLYRTGTGKGGAGGSASVTDDELAAAQKLFQAQGGTGIASGKPLQAAINLVRATKGDTNELVNSATTAKATYKAKTGTGTGGGSSASIF